MSICSRAKSRLTSGCLSARPPTGAAWPVPWAEPEARVRLAPVVRRPPSHLNHNIAATAALLRPGRSRSHHRPPSLSVWDGFFPVFLSACRSLLLLLFSSSAFVDARDNYRALKAGLDDRVFQTSLRRFLCSRSAEPQLCAETEHRVPNTIQ